MGPFRLPPMTCLGLGGLAGILSLGEEKRSRTHAWHMTLPISARRQWFIKLLMALFAGLACAVLFPALTMIAGGSIYGSPLMYVHVGVLQADLIVIPILIFACFWCACVANGTVRSVTWVFPVTAAIFFASSGGVWLGQELARTTGTLKDFVVSSFHLSPLALAAIIEFLWVLRCLLPVAAVTILWSFSAYAGLVSSRWEPFEETRQALDKFHPGTAKIELSGENLAKGSALTTPTRRWLKGSRITVAPAHSQVSAYLATIHLASGLECRLTVTLCGGTAASCGKV
jgi:hypothetical protein